MRVAALIPAKAHSRRLPDKNLKMLAGLPLFMHSVQLALSVAAIDVVYVSSDAKSVLDLTTDAGAQGLQRPSEFCTDETTNFQVMCHHLAQLRVKGQEPDVIVLLQPTTPFRQANALAEFIQRFVEDQKADSLITVRRTARPRGRLEQGYWMRETSSMNHGGRLQTADVWHEATGHAILLRPKRTLDKGTLLGEFVRAEPLPVDWADIDIDTPCDWDLAQAYSAAIRSGK